MYIILLTEKHVQHPVLNSDSVCMRTWYCIGFFMDACLRYKMVLKERRETEKRQYDNQFLMNEWASFCGFLSCVKYTCSRTKTRKGERQMRTMKNLEESGVHEVTKAAQWMMTEHPWKARSSDCRSVTSPWTSSTWLGGRLWRLLEGLTRAFTWQSPRDRRAWQMRPPSNPEAPVTSTVSVSVSVSVFLSFPASHSD